VSCPSCCYFLEGKNDVEKCWRHRVHERFSLMKVKLLFLLTADPMTYIQARSKNAETRLKDWQITDNPACSPAQACKSVRNGNSRVHAVYASGFAVVGCTYVFREFKTRNDTTTINPETENGRWRSNEQSRKNKKKTTDTSMRLFYSHIFLLSSTVRFKISVGQTDTLLPRY
jgi:hypothetical protein